MYRNNKTKKYKNTTHLSTIPHCLVTLTDTQRFILQHILYFYLFIYKEILSCAMHVRMTDEDNHGRGVTGNFDSILKLIPRIDSMSHLWFIFFLFDLWIPRISCSGLFIFCVWDRFLHFSGCSDVVVVISSSNKEEQYAIMELCLFCLKMIINKVYVCLWEKGKKIATSLPQKNGTGNGVELR